VVACGIAIGWAKKKANTMKNPRMDDSLSRWKYAVLDEQDKQTAQSSIQS
jgi:hypothetical protein